MAPALAPARRSKRLGAQSGRKTEYNASEMIAVVWTARVKIRVSASNVWK
jgi:hypothetical protein